MRQLRQELIEFLLAIGQFPTATVVDAEAVHYTVNDEEAVFVGCKTRGESVQQFQLVLKKKGVNWGRANRFAHQLTSLLRARP